MILAALIIAFNGLGLTLRHRPARPRDAGSCRTSFVALLILAFGAYFARFVGDAVHHLLPQRRHAATRDLLGKLAQYAIMVFVVLIALDQVKVGGDIVRQSFLIILAGVVLRAGAGLRPRRQGLGRRRGIERLVADDEAAAERTGAARPGRDAACQRTGRHAAAQNLHDDRPHP